MDGSTALRLKKIFIVVETRFCPPPTPATLFPRVFVPSGIPAQHPAPLQNLPKQLCPCRAYVSRGCFLPGAATDRQTQKHQRQPSLHPARLPHKLQMPMPMQAPTSRHPMA